MSFFANELCKNFPHCAILGEFVLYVRIGGFIEIGLNLSSFTSLHDCMAFWFWAVALSLTPSFLVIDEWVCLLCVLCVWIQDQKIAKDEFTEFNCRFPYECCYKRWSECCAQTSHALSFGKRGHRSFTRIPAVFQCRIFSLASRKRLRFRIRRVTSIPILLKLIKPHLPFLSWYCCQNLPFWPKCLRYTNSYHEIVPICVAMFLQKY